jgi:hypothetical protein
MVPVLVILTAAAGLGVYNLWQWWQGRRSMGLIAGHLLLGVGGAEALVGVLHSSDLSDDDPVRHSAKLVLLLLGAAIFWRSPRMSARASPGFCCCSPWADGFNPLALNAVVASAAKPPSCRVIEAFGRPGAGANAARADPRRGWVATLRSRRRAIPPKATCFRERCS